MQRDSYYVRRIPTVTFQTEARVNRSKAPQTRTPCTLHLRTEVQPPSLVSAAKHQHSCTARFADSDHKTSIAGGALRHSSTPSSALTCRLHGIGKGQLMGSEPSGCRIVSSTTATSSPGLSPPPPPTPLLERSLTASTSALLLRSKSPFFRRSPHRDLSEYSIWWVAKVAGRRRSDMNT